MFTITPSNAALGATVEGLDLSEPIDASIVSMIRGRLLEHQVLFFPGQHLTPVQQMRFGSAFGALERHAALDSLSDTPEVVVFDTEEGATTADMWHSDVTCAPRPPMGAILQMVIAPPAGGATHWASMTAAYDALDDGMKERLVGLHARHRSWWQPTVENVHPVVRVHPETARQALFVNRLFTIRIEELDEAESDELLDSLIGHATRDEFTVKHSWQSGDVAFWDNRCTLHRVDNDFGAARRRGHRIVVEGDAPR